MSEIKRTNVVVEAEGLGPCEVFYGVYEVTNSPALVLVQVQAPNGAAPITHNLPELELANAVVLQPEYEMLAPQLIEGGILEAKADFTVLDMLLAGKNAVTGMDAKLLAAPVRMLAHPEEARPDPAPEAQAEAQEPGEDKAEAQEPGEDKAEEQPDAPADPLADIMDKMGIHDDVKFVTRLELKPGQTAQQAFAEHAAANPVLQLEKDVGKRPAFLDAEAQAALNALPGRVANPMAFVALRRAMRGYVEARNRLDEAGIRLVAHMARALSQDDAASGAANLKILDSGICKGLHEYMLKMADAADEEMGPIVAQLRADGAKLQQEFDAALADANGDFQKAMLYGSINELPQMLRSLVDKLQEMKQKAKDGA